MSIHVMSWVLRHSEERLGNRLVLLVLADHADENGDRSFPSVETMGREARLGERQTRNCLRALEKSRAIKCTGTLKSGTRIYSVAMGAQIAGGQKLPGQNQSGPESNIAPESSGNRPSAPPPTPGAKARTPKTVSGIKVTEDEHDLVDLLLAKFNERAGANFAGKEWRESIVRRIREHQDMIAAEHLALIDPMFDRPWWKGSPTPSVIWGNGKTFDMARNSAQGAKVDPDDDVSYIH